MDTPQASLNARQRTVQHLQELYAVVVGVALTLAITNLVNVDKKATPVCPTDSIFTTIPLHICVLPYFLAYLVTLVPFYHGGMRHLDITYFEDPLAQTQRGALMFDWALLFSESCLLLVLALLLQNPEPFGWVLCGLLAFDSLWAFIAHLAFAPAVREYRVELKWALINVITACLLVLILTAENVFETQPHLLDSFRWVSILVVTVARTICDYAWSWSYYYPPDHSQ
jgi:hypothetical protein